MLESSVYDNFLLIVSLVGCEIVYRIFVATYEYKINWKHYMPQNRFRQVIKFCILKWHPRMYCGLAVMIVLLLIVQGDDKDTWILLKQNIQRLAPPYFILRLLKFTYNNIELAEWIRGSSGLDYGTGMASNYFHGYIRLALPSTGHSTKGIVERIQDYEDDQHVVVPIKKLFILIPQSMFTKPKIESRVMIPAKELETVQLDRAGVKRPFKNAVYRIEKCGPKNDKVWYVVLEGATPMNSFFEVLHYQFTRSNEMDDMKREITLKFYLSLKQILADCPSTKDLIELIYYNDVTAEGKPVDVGEIVRERITTLVERDEIQLQ